MPAATSIVVVAVYTFISHTRTCRPRFEDLSDGIHVFADDRGDEVHLDFRCGHGCSPTMVAAAKYPAVSAISAIKPPCTTPNVCSNSSRKGEGFCKHPLQDLQPLAQESRNLGDFGPSSQSSKCELTRFTLEFEHGRFGSNLRQQCRCPVCAVINGPYNASSFIVNRSTFFVDNLTTSLRSSSSPLDRNWPSIRRNGVRLGMAFQDFRLQQLVQIICLPSTLLSSSAFRRL